VLNKELINLINTNVVKLIFDFSAEGTPRHSWFPPIHRMIKKYKIKSSNVYFISMDMKLGENYDIWSEKLNLPKINIIGLNYFVEYATHWVLKKKKFPIEDFKVDKIREKKFTCLNGAYRENRIIIVSELFRNGLENDGYISCIGNYGEPPRDIRNSAEVDKDLTFKDLIKYYMDSVYPKLPIVIDMEKDMELIEPYIGHSYVHEMYTNSYFNIVTETSYNFDTAAIIGNSIFLTEKTYRAIFGMQPFIVVSNPGFLKFLKSIGFKTFPEFFDESYDEIENPIERMNTIVNEIKKICSLSLEELHDRYYNIFDKLEHNRNRLIEMVNDRKMNYGNYLDVFE
jgi:hypothetical protein